MIFQGRYLKPPCNGNGDERVNFWPASQTTQI